MFEVNDLVITRAGLPAVVTAVHDHSHLDGVPTLYSLHGVVGPLVEHTADELAPVAHRPAPGQVWRYTGDPTLTVTVVSVEHGGLFADCRTPSGAVSAMVLIALYELVGEAS